MGFEDGDIEKGKSSGKPKTSFNRMTLQKAVDMGEYNPDYLATFPEWSTLSKHIQYQFIKTAIDNRHKQLIMQFAEINNVLDFRLKPHLKIALKNINNQLRNLEEDREKLLFEYSK